MMRKASGNMYPFVTHTWCPIRGQCPHGCAYCYMNKIYRRFGKTPAPLHLDERELKADLGEGNFIFVGSSCDMWADNVPDMWINSVMNKIMKHKNKYLFQSKNPKRFRDWEICYAGNTQDFVLATTLETNRHYPQMSGDPLDRAIEFRTETIRPAKMVTCEPLMDFDIEEMIRLIKIINPFQVNIGADTGNNHLPEPPKENVLEYIYGLEKFTKVLLKKNIWRLLK